ncbi:hypothetical protein [Rossellomorea sp. DUT-2]|uniref:hypothetical protein n=1 Tax=Rossellomorea sp. DUT-2 TaxID=3412021 RepID=UPI003D172131
MKDKDAKEQSNDDIHNTISISIHRISPNPELSTKWNLYQKSFYIPIFSSSLLFMGSLFSLGLFVSLLIISYNPSQCQNGACYDYTQGTFSKKETHPVLDKSHSFFLILYYWYIKLIVRIKEKSFYSGESFMWNKKRILTLSVMLIIVVLFILTKVVATSSTTAIVTVLEKNYVEEQEEAFMIVIPPGGDQSTEYWKNAKI